MTMVTTYLTALQAATSYGVDGDGNLMLSGTATLTFLAWQKEAGRPP